MLINFSVIVMRESRIDYYDPVYRSPFYPYMQIAGVLACLFLISYIGPDALALTLGVVILSVIWYLAYANRRVIRHGAIFHWFSQLGAQRYEGLEHELREILKEKGLRREDPYEEIIGRAHVIEAAPRTTFDALSQRVMQIMSQRQPLLTPDHGAQFVDTIHTNFTLVNHGAAMPALRLEEVSDFEMVIVRSKDGVYIDHNADDRTQVKIHAFFFLVSPAEDSGRHLRILAQIANHVEDGNFEQDWLHAEGEQELREILLHENRLLTLWLEPGHRTEGLIDKKLREIEWPGNALVALIRRGKDEIIPHGETVMQPGDRITIIGDPDDIQSLYTRYVGDEGNVQKLGG
jgi:mannitol/fructose-specific phosphotransferase system IIA component (Ntr-type)